MMMMMRCVALTGLAMLAAACVAPPAPSNGAGEAHAHGTAGQVPAGLGELTVIGPAGQTVRLSLAELAKLPHVDVSADMHGQKHAFSGVLLSDLLGQAGAPTGAGLRGAELTHVVLVSARDGYRVALSLAETDAAIRPMRVIVADTMDGAPVPAADGPFRLVVEGDLKPARSARMIERIEVRKLD